MTGLEIQQRFDALIADLQTVGKGREIAVVFRNSSNAAQVFPLSSDNLGIIADAQRENLQTFIDEVLKPAADDYSGALAPVTALNEAFRLAQVPHQALIDAASAARVALQNALNADGVYLAAKQDLDDARTDAAFLAKRDAYNANNVSENYAELANAKGKYV